MKHEFIEFINVNKDFDTPTGPLQVLTDITFTCQRGRILCVVGPSGCGKTTILNLIAGFVEPSTGSMYVDGASIQGPGSDRAVVFQDDSVFPWLSVRGNLNYGPKVRGLSKKHASKRVEAYLEKVGLTSFAESYPKELSGGMKKRVDIARAYVNDPKILLMDEPFGPLDVMTKEDMQAELLRLNIDEDKTIIFITHDIEEAVFLGDTVLVMTSRPATIQKVIYPSFEKPRSPEIKMSPIFQEIRNKIDGITRHSEEVNDEG